jgi:hypothetical protein
MGIANINIINVLESKKMSREHSFASEKDNVLGQKDDVYVVKGNYNDHDTNSIPTRMDEHVKMKSNIF